MTDERLVAEWTERPFTGHRKRHIDVHHRVVMETFEGVGVDVRHEVKSEHGPNDGWFTAEVWESREHGTHKLKPTGGRWWE